MTTKQALEQTVAALDLARRCKVKPHIRLVRYKKVLIKLLEWEKNLRIAQGRLKLYRAKRKYYEKIMKGGT